MVYDVVVIGAGVEGLGTAYYLAKQGLNVLTIEQFPWPHNRGSSTGHSRALRKTYPSRFQHHAVLADRARAKWRQLEQESGLEIYKEIGVLSVALDPETMRDHQLSLQQNKLANTTLSIAEVHKKYPAFQLPPTASASLEKEGGILLADNAMKAFMNMYRHYGGNFRDRERVTNIIPGRIVQIITDKGTYQTRRLVITAGPWSQKMLLKIFGLQLPIQPTKITVMYWKEKTEGILSSSKVHGFRFIDGHKGTLIFAIPSTEYPGLVKLSLHDGPPTDPDMRDAVDNPEAIQIVSGFIRKYLPGLEDKPSIVEQCIYSNTPDGEFILDHLPSHRNIVIGAGFSGTGFKMAPVIGELLGKMVYEEDPGFNMVPFAMKRFLKNNSKL